jgi:aspartate ammonia-lyase
MTETDKAQSIYHFSNYTIHPLLLRSLLIIKRSAAETNMEMGYMKENLARPILEVCEEMMELSDDDLVKQVPLDPYQGGAGTSINMAINELIAKAASKKSKKSIDPFLHLNLHQSTNDVMPSALKIMLQKAFIQLEETIADFQQRIQILEQKYANVYINARTQLQDATLMSLGKLYATWAGALSRDRWRCYKARERLKEINLGGTAIGTGAGAPKQYCLNVVKILQRYVSFPITRADDLVEATSNYDTVAEAMASLRILGQNIRRISNDIRLLSAGPSAWGEFRLPSIIKGSSIMPGKVNPTICEASIQIAERIISNDSLIARLCSQTELQLNAFFPLISHVCSESIMLVQNVMPSLIEYIEEITVDKRRINKNRRDAATDGLALLPLLGYRALEAFILQAREEKKHLSDLAKEHLPLTDEEIKDIFSPNRFASLGYDEAFYAKLKSDESKDWASVITHFETKRDTE